MRSTTTIRVSKELAHWIRFHAKNELLTVGEFLDLHLRDMQPSKRDNRGKRKRPSVAVAVSTGSSIGDLEYWRRRYEGVPSWAQVVD